MGQLATLLVLESFHTRRPGIRCCEFVDRCTLRGGSSPRLEGMSCRINLELPHTEVDWSWRFRYTYGRRILRWSLRLLAGAGL